VREQDSLALQVWLAAAPRQAALVRVQRVRARDRRAQVSA